MTDRKYTVAEIDLMRTLIGNRYLYGAFQPRFEPGHSYNSRAYTEADMARAVEEQLRTYMAAGLGPDDLIDPIHAEAAPDD